jgi:hypothetical protein
MMAAAMALTFTACNNDEGDDSPTPTPSGTITASVTTSAGDQNPNWSLPVVTARMSFFNLTFTARDTDTGEMLILNMVNNGEGSYYSEMLDVSVGGGNYFANSNAEAQVSLSIQESAFMFVEVTSIDTIAKLIDATFSVWVYASDTANAPYTIFQNGVLDNVPYTGSSQDVIFGGNSTLTATVDGAAFQPEFITTFDQFLAVQINTGTIAGEALSITIPYTLRSGTYSLEIDANDLDDPILASYGSGVQPAIASEGTITFTRDFVSQNIQGTFSFNAPNFFNGEVYEVTNGAFNVRY